MQISPLKTIYALPPSPVLYLIPENIFIAPRAFSVAFPCFGGHLYIPEEMLTDFFAVILSRLSLPRLTYR